MDTETLGMCGKEGITFTATGENRPKDIFKNISSAASIIGSYNSDTLMSKQIKLFLTHQVFLRIQLLLEKKLNLKKVSIFFETSVTLTSFFYLL